MRLSKISLIFLAVLTVLSCRKDQTSDPTTIINVPPFEVVNSYTVDIQGFVTTPEGVAIENALIQVGNQQVRTTEAGTFYVEKMLAPENGLYILADQEGFFKGGTSIYAYANQLYTVDIILIPFNDSVSFDSGDGVEVVNDDGSILKIEANTIVDENGSVYAGQVDAYMYWIDPTAENMTNLSPGPLVGFAENERQSLRSFGMIGVELFGASGESLNIGDSFDASLTFPVPSEILSEAPAVIDLWHFSEDLGLWDLKGSAELVNGKYEAKVPHFSWWNCDFPLDFGLVCFNVINEEGRQVGNLDLEISAGPFGVASAVINPDGTFCHLVPLGTDLIISVSTYCGDVLLQETIPPIVDGQEITLQVPTIIDGFVELNISGSVTCGDTDPITNGLVVMTFAEVSFLDYVDDQGNYSIDFISCLEDGYTANVTAYDLDGLSSGSAEVSIFDQNIEFDIDGCNTELGDENMLVTSGQEVYLFSICEANVSSAEITIIAKIDENQGDYIILGVDGFGQGEFTGNLLSNNNTISSINLSEAGLTSISITNYSEVPGEKIVGTFTMDETTGVFVAIVQ